MKGLDQNNRKILNLLQRNGRMTNAELAERTGLSPATTLERVKKLERQGFISGYVALLNREMVGRGTLAFAHVSLTQHTRETVSGFKEAISELPEVLEVYHMAGEYDFILKLALKSVSHYEEFAVNQLTSIPYIGRIWTSFVLREVKNDTALILPENNS
jgi:Lrp/AsnC family leucine-responsive transcriptional regulator